MRNVLILFFLTLCWPVVVLPASVEPTPMVLFSRETSAPVNFKLSDSDWRWLGTKRDVNIAIYGPGNPPFNIIQSPNTVEGISVDYSLLVFYSLGLRPNILHYPDSNAALEALNKGEVDMLIDDSNEQLTKHLSSTPFMPDLTVLVSREASYFPQAKTSTSTRIALLQGSLGDEWLLSYYPDAKITHYESSAMALFSVAIGENDYFIGSQTVANFLIQRNYANMMSVADIFPAQKSGPRFVFRPDGQTLQRVVNTVLKAIPSAEHKAILRQWSQESISAPLALTEKEKRWLTQHGDLRAVIDPLYAPFTVFDPNEKLHGVAADIIRLIHLRTGLSFKTVQSASIIDTIKMLNDGKGDFIAALTYSDARDKLLLFIHPYVSTPFVLVVKNTASAPTSVNGIMRLSITPNSQFQEQLKEQHPGISFLEAKNTSAALQLVIDGKADGAISNLISANYMIDHYFRGDLKVVSRLGKDDALISFAVRRDQPELYSILNKALAAIPPSEISMIINKWQGAPKIKLDTWTIYSAQFYWLTGIFFVLVSTSLVWNYYLRKEVRTRHSIQLKLQEQSTLRETLFNGTPMPTYVVDLEGNILSHNQAWDEFFIQETKDLATMPLTSREHPLFIINFALTQVRTLPVKSAPQRYRLSNGVEERVILHQSTPFKRSDGELLGLICSWQDMTEYEFLIKELSAARENAEQANRTKSTFLATMSHEIRTPLSAIIGLLELAVTNKGHPETEESIQVAYESAHTLMGLVGDILDIAKIESGKLELTLEWMKFNELFSPVIPVFMGLARQKHLELTCDIDVLHPEEIYVDPIRLHQIMFNLVSNAIKFTEQGSVDIQVKCLSGSDQQVMLELVVNDTGVGIPQDDQPQIFSPYKQSDAGKKQVGTGLGLSICAQLVSMMGGTIELFSQPGRGTRITVEISVEHRQYAIEPIEMASVPVDDAQPLSILVVDDHSANRLLLKRQLSFLGHHVIEAINGVQALQLWRKSHVELIITDCSMPVMDGLELTKCLRKEQQVPLIILGLTANAQPEERARCLAAGMDDCLFKPLQLSQLEIQLNKIPRQPQQRQEPGAVLEDLIDLTALQQLAQQDTGLLRDLLRTTHDENIRDIQQLHILIESKAWASLPHTLHRLAGAAQIIGAAKAERYCRELEEYCENSPDVDEVIKRVKQVLASVAELNNAINVFITSRQSH